MAPTAHLARIRIAGFKSFADPVALDVLPGLTGLVGPNGCGKSNLAEALRWAMGEASARTLRGDAVDGLIFAGTAARPGPAWRRRKLRSRWKGAAFPPASPASRLCMCPGDMGEFEDSGAVEGCV